MTKKNLKAAQDKPDQISWNTARSNDGSLQITYSIHFELIEKNREKAVSELGKNINVPGFRKGKAPRKKLLEHIPENTLLEKTLSYILPEALGETIRKENLNLAVYPKFELVKAKENEDWQVRANTAEMPKVELGDYKEIVKGETRAKSIWTPGKDNKDDKKKPSREDLEQQVISILLEKISITIPKMLVDDEVNARISRLIEKIDKMGLELDSYLQSVGKTAQQLREEYETQAKNALSLDLILSKIAREENIKIEEKQVSEALRVSGNDQTDDPNQLEQRKHMIRGVLTRREALNKLVSLVN